MNVKPSAPPTLADHSTRTRFAFSMRGGSAGVGPGLPEQPARPAAARKSPTLKKGAGPFFWLATRSFQKKGPDPFFLSATERLEPHAHALAESALLPARLFERELVGGARLCRLVLGHQDVAAQRGELRLVRRRVLGLEDLQRLVVGFFIEHDGGQPQARDVAEVLRRRVLDHPLELRLGGLEV